MIAATALVKTLAAHGVDRIFCVPGESYLPVLDALYDEPGIQVVNCRHEGGAGLMAVADAKLTRRHGVVCVSRGPGASNAALAIHVAEQVARAANMSAFYFCKVFKAATGLTFTHYVARARIERTKRMLLNPHTRISEAAYEAGFQSLSQFNRVFRRVTGQSPTVWRATRWPGRT